MPGMETRAPERTETSSGLWASPNFSPTALLDEGEGGLDLVLELGGVVAVIVVEGGADLGGDGEAGGHRQVDAGHLGQVGALAAEEVAHLGPALVMPAPKL